MTCKYGRNLSLKGKNDAWISCDLDINSLIPDRFYIVARDGVHAMSIDINKEKLESWLNYIKLHENKKYVEAVKN